MKRESKQQLAKLANKPNRRFGSGDYTMSPEDQTITIERLMKKAFEHNSRINVCAICGVPGGTLLAKGKKPNRIYVHLEKSCQEAFDAMQIGLTKPTKVSKKVSSKT